MKSTNQMNPDLEDETMMFEVDEIDEFVDDQCSKQAKSMSVSMTDVRSRHDEPHEHHDYKANKNKYGGDEDETKQNR